MEPSGPGGPGAWEPPEEYDEPNTRLRYAVIGAAAAVVVVALILGLLAFLGGGGDDAADVSSTSTFGTSTTLLPATTTTLPTTTSTIATTSTAVVTLPRLTVLTGRLEYGTSASNADVLIRNDGGQVLRYTVTTSNPHLGVGSRTGSLGPGESATVRITLDRAGSPEGPVTGDVTVDAGDAGEAVLPVSGSVVRPPTLTGVTIAGTSFHTTCDPDDQTVEVSATVGDDTGVARVELRWTSPANGDGTKNMAVDGAGHAIADLGPFASSDTVTWQVVVTDAAGNQTSSNPAQIDVLDCGSA